MPSVMIEGTRMSLETDRRSLGDISATAASSYKAMHRPWTPFGPSFLPETPLPNWRWFRGATGDGILAESFISFQRGKGNLVAPQTFYKGVWNMLLTWPV
jgi:hypothetical protein